MKSTKVKGTTFWKHLMYISPTDYVSLRGKYRWSRHVSQITKTTEFLSLSIEKRRKKYPFPSTSNNTDKPKVRRMGGGKEGPLNVMSFSFYLRIKENMFSRKCIPLPWQQDISVSSWNFSWSFSRVQNSCPHGFLQPFPGQIGRIQIALVVCKMGKKLASKLHSEGVNVSLLRLAACHK